jgi:serine/threonine kinase 38
MSSFTIESRVSTPSATSYLQQAILVSSLYDRDCLSLILEYVPGGDILMALIERKTFPVSPARFPPGETTLALHSVRRLNVFLKYLRPDNILISEDGHIKLSGFRLAKNHAENNNKLQAVLDQIRDLMTQHYSVQRSTESKPYVYGMCEFIA